MYVCYVCMFCNVMLCNVKYVYMHVMLRKDVCMLCMYACDVM